MSELTDRLRYDKGTRYQSREMIQRQGDRFNAAGEIEKLEGEIEGLREALTPSAETKATYIGEFAFYKSTFDEDISVQVPWTTIKEIMAAIRGRASSSPKETKP